MSVDYCGSLICPPQASNTHQSFNLSNGALLLRMSLLHKLLMSFSSMECGCAWSRILDIWRIISIVAELLSSFQHVTGCSRSINVEKTHKDINNI